MILSHLVSPTYLVATLCKVVLGSCTSANARAAASAGTSPTTALLPNAGRQQISIPAYVMALCCCDIAHQSKAVRWREKFRFLNYLPILRYLIGRYLQKKLI